MNAITQITASDWTSSLWATHDPLASSAMSSSLWACHTVPSRWKGQPSRFQGVSPAQAVRGADDGLQHRPQHQRRSGRRAAVQPPQREGGGPRRGRANGRRTALTESSDDVPAPVNGKFSSTTGIL